MGPRDVVVVPTGTANLASMLAALARAGARARLAQGPDELAAAERVVVPGVGAFGAARDRLVTDGLWGPLRERLGRGAPTLLVCLGLQLLCRDSEESPGAEGLGVVPASVRRLPAGVRVPQLGWTLVEADPDARHLESGYAYFANSYCLPAAPPPWRAAFARHGDRFVAAMEAGDVLACQFHPELSGAYGLALIERWLAGGGRARSAGPTARVIPCLDVRDGRVVKGVKFAALRDAGAPDERAALYEAQGADELVVLDVSATNEGRKTRADTVAAVRARLGIPLTVGGGVRGVDDGKRLLDAGADKVAVNTAALDDPGLVGALAARFGRQCVVASIDAARAPAGGWEVVTHAGTRRTGLDAVAWAREAVARGAGEVLLTSFDRDGTREGYDLELVRAVASAVAVPVVASGGASTVEHLAEALAAGADAVLAASLFHDGDMTVGEAKAALARAGARVRLS